MPMLDFILLAAFVLFVLNSLFPKKKAEKKTPEQELGDAIAKYLSQVKQSPEE